MNLGDFASGIIQGILKLLPLDPFKDTIASFSQIPYLHYVNYFIPFSDILTIFAVWLGAYTLWLVYQAVARWLKLIK